MKSQFDRKSNYSKSILPLTVALILVASGLRGSDLRAGTTLVVQVLPDVLLEASPPISWITTEENQSLSIDLKVIVRLHSGTHGTLRISLPGVAPSDAAQLAVETEAGVEAISTTPVLLRHYAGSGVYNDTILVQRSASEEDEPFPSSLMLRLVSSDGAITGSKVVTLPSTSSPKD